jgi:hypothetical protein
MSRSIPLAAALVASLALTGVAQAKAPDPAGHNGPTRKLEAAFKVAQFERAGDPNGCYPNAPTMAALIIERTGQAAGVIGNQKSIKKPNIIFVVSGATRCGNMRMALLAKKRLWVLDSSAGKLQVAGRKKKALPGSRGPLRALKTISRNFSISEADAPERLIVLCKKGSYPMGGGMSATPSPAPDGEGVYPHSYERLGAQRGWHVNPVLVDPSPEQTTPRTVTMQVVCGKGIVPRSAPHKTIFLKSGQTGSAIARCRKGEVLVSGGFQRTNFVRHGGDYITESRAIGSRAWKVAGRAFGLFGGELSAIAYCDRSKKPLLTQVKASVPVGDHLFAKTTTPRCPKGRRLTLGGFATHGSTNALIADGIINKNNSFTASAFGYFGPAPNLTAYGYCMKPGSGRP